MFQSDRGSDEVVELKLHGVSKKSNNPNSKALYIKNTGAISINIQREYVFIGIMSILAFVNKLK